MYVYMCIKFITVSEWGRRYYHRYLQISKEQYASNPERFGNLAMVTMVTQESI